MEFNWKITLTIKALRENGQGNGEWEGRRMPAAVIVSHCEDSTVSMAWFLAVLSLCSYIK
jgi:hypothetical protein